MLLKNMMEGSSLMNLKGDSDLQQYNGYCSEKQSLDGVIKNKDLFIKA